MQGKTKFRPLLWAVAILIAVAGFLLWHGDLAGWVSVGQSNAWRNFTGTHETFPFRVENGKGFVYQGPNYDDPVEPVVSRPDWTISRFGRTYVLFDVNPGDMEPSMFQGEFKESLWIGLLDGEGKVVRKTRLATGVKNITGVRYGGRSGAFVRAKAADGSKRSIALTFPAPLPEWKPSGDAWRDYERRQERLETLLWEDWPDNGSGYATDWVTKRLEEALNAECRAAIEALKAAAPSDARRNELDAERESAMSLAWMIAGDSSAEAANVHWGNATDRMTRERAKIIYLRNWLEARDHPDGWEVVRGATGELYGMPFAATSGVAVLTVSEDWLWRRWDGKPEPEADEATPPSADTEPESEKSQVLLRLSPADIRKDGDSFSVFYDLVAPECQDSGYKVGKGRLVLNSPAP